MMSGEQDMGDYMLRYSRLDMAETRQNGLESWSPGQSVLNTENSRSEECSKTFRIIYVNHDIRLRHPQSLRQFSTLIKNRASHDAAESNRTFLDFTKSWLFMPTTIIIFLYLFLLMDILLSLRLKISTSQGPPCTN
ncbi:uncharacterized protein PHALS_15244 [Plasmopara halstedii]|uniref:Uncharacterized protein n=1 Tax=Plasmopara halstedii TaxID=4781 RepID=A0A0P1B7I7_PLAHL|nr:uncharacterized protein PHALS_15244 [Plasmopara halstedii]CEG49904.1 hypothetical protein PHALS_15244 [Plasmopara halstedii]|eukprot:XP_024586273.1 hypothetical protein PHALS_15244 [Plasmopara halstedii]